MIPDTVPVSGVWLRKIGNEVQVLFEVDEKWRLVVVEPEDGNYSHIVETEGILSSHADPVVAR
jgi:hypothetical protein